MKIETGNENRNLWSESEPVIRVGTGDDKIRPGDQNRNRCMKLSEPVIRIGSGDQNRNRWWSIGTGDENRNRWSEYGTGDQNRNRWITNRIHGDQNRQPVMRSQNRWSESIYRWSESEPVMKSYGTGDHESEPVIRIGTGDQNRSEPVMIMYPDVAQLIGSPLVAQLLNRIVGGPDPTVLIWYTMSMGQRITISYKSWRIKSKSGPANNDSLQ